MKSKNRRNNRKRSLSLLLLMLFTAVLLSTSTYAWFTANKVVTISPIQVNVEAQGGIQISADGINWRSVISVADLTAVNATTYTASVNQIPETLNPVSSALEVDADGRMEMFYGTVSADGGGVYTLAATQDVEQEGLTGNFIAFDLFFMSDANAQLFLTTNSQIVSADQEDKGIKNAARIAFVHLGTTAIGSSIGTIQGLNAGVTSPVHLWEPNYDVHTAAGVAHAFNTYGQTVTLTGNAAPLAYSGVFAEIPAGANVPVSSAVGTTSYVRPVTPDYATIDGFSTDLQVFSLTQGISKIRIYMWIEGQDVDCENQASGSNIIFNVQFSTP